MAYVELAKPQSYLTNQLLLTLSLLLATFPSGSVTQSTSQNTAPTALPTTIPTLTDPDDPDFSLPSGSTTGIARPTGYTYQPNPDDGDTEDGSSHDVLNYYFLLLVIFVAIIITAYCCVLRRRQRKVARLQGNRQDALAQDLEGWSGGRRWGHLRWRSEPRMEGLNERGEAPPPYMPDRPAEVHATVSGRQEERPIPLEEWHKPPDYQQAPISPVRAEEVGPPPGPPPGRG